MAMSTSLKGYLDHAVGVGAAAIFVDCINNQHTTLVDNWFRSACQKLVDGIGEADALITAISSSGTLSVAAMNRLEHELGGRGNAEELKTLAAAGSGA